MKEFVLLESVLSAVKSYPMNVGNMLAGMNKLKRYTLEDEATALLKKVCEYVDGYEGNSPGRFDDGLGEHLRELSSIPGLPEWWNLHKEKSEREKKLLSLCEILIEYRDAGGMTTPQDVAEAILKALEDQK